MEMQPMKSMVLFAFIFSFVFAGVGWAEDSVKYMEVAPKEEAQALAYIKTLPIEKLLEKGDLARTRFFWAVCNGDNQIRDYILSKVDGEILAEDPENQKLFSCCNGNSWCPADNIKGIGSLGFHPSADDLMASLQNSTQCSVDKFDATLAFNPPFDAKKDGANLLHRIVSASAQGRPILTRDCLVHALEKVSKAAPQLLTEKDLDGHTPLELAVYLKGHPHQWGSSITAKDFGPIIQELEILSKPKK